MVRDAHAALPAGDIDSGRINVVIETPRESRNKFDHDPELGVFKLGKPLPAGSIFPYDFGYIPQTLGEDGDPLDVLVLMDAPAFTGCLVECRVIGVIDADQTERDGETTRNDRVIAVAEASRDYRDARTLDDLPPAAVDEIEHFFVSYNRFDDKEFRLIGRGGPEEGVAAIRRACDRAREQAANGSS